MWIKASPPENISVGHKRKVMTAFSDPTSTVFVVDDDDAVRESLIDFLDVLGFQVEGFASIAEFVQGHRKVPKSCLILDHFMQPTTGLDFLESDEGKNLRLPVILISGDVDTTIEQRARDAGVAAFLEKPLPLKKLLQHIRHLTA